MKRSSLWEVGSALVILGGIACSEANAPEPEPLDDPSGPFTLSSPQLPNVPNCSVDNPDVCAVFPPEHTSYQGNANVSPQLTWASPPPGTQSFALELKDLTHGQPMWAIWNIPGDLRALPAGIANDTTTPPSPAGAVQSSAIFAPSPGYFGPQVACNVYQFTLHALAIAQFNPSQPDFVALVGDDIAKLGADLLESTTLTARNHVAGECP